MLVSSIAYNIGAMNNAAYSMMSANDSLLGLTKFAGSSSNLSLLNQQEKILLLDKQKAQLIYNISDAQYESLKKMEKDKIKRSFSTFA